MSTAAKVKSIAIINSKAPFSSSHGKDALDAALIYGSYEQNVSLFFQGDGIWQLIAVQTPELISNKDYLKTFSAFNFYDIEHIYVCQQSLKERGLFEPTFHINNVLQLTPSQFAEKLQLQDIILRF